MTTVRTTRSERGRLKVRIYNAELHFVACESRVKADGNEVRAQGVIKGILPGHWSLRDGLLEAYKTESGLLVG